MSMYTRPSPAVHTDEIIVKDIADMPAPVSGVISLEAGKQYVLNNTISSPFPLAFPGDGKTSSWTTVNRSAWTYTGTDACWKDLTAAGNIELTGPSEFQAPNGAIFDIDSGAPQLSWSFQAFGLPRFTNCKSLGTVKGPGGFNTFFGSYTNFEDGMVLDDLTFNEHNLMFVLANPNQVLNYDGQTVNFTSGETVTGGTSGATGVVEFDRDDGTSGKLTLSGISGTFQDDEALTGSSTGVAVVNGILENMVIFTVKGANTVGPVNFFSLDWFSDVNQTLFDIDREIFTNVDTISLLNNRAQITANPPAFTATSIDQSNIKVTSNKNTFFPDSTVKAKLDVVGNTNVTNIVTQDVAVPINTTWTDGTVEERLVFRDDCTFDNTTNTITSFNNIIAVPAAFNHGMNNGDNVIFTADGGLPPEISPTIQYFIVNATATTFQISLTLGGSVVTFSTDGTTPNYYNHITGNSVTGWVIYVGIQDISLVIQGWVGLDKSGTAQNFGTQVIKTDTSFVETNGARGSNVIVQQGKGQSSTVSDIVNLKTGEGIKVFIENREGIDDVTVVDADLTFNLA